jgi:ABC-type phosphate transport system substrate-binding protein
MNTLFSSTIGPEFVRIAGEQYLLGQRLLRVLVFVLLGASLAAARDIALVSNKTNSVSAVTLPDLVRLCKAQTGHWPDGKPVTFVMRSPSAPEMKTVLEKVYGMSERELDSLIVVSNHGRPVHPAIVIVASDEELVNKVASTPGAIGVVDVYSINSSVSVMKIAGKLPLEPGYLLHGN